MNGVFLKEELDSLHEQQVIFINELKNQETMINIIIYELRGFLDEKFNISNEQCSEIVEKIGVLEKNILRCDNNLNGNFKVMMNNQVEMIKYIESFSINLMKITAELNEVKKHIAIEKNDIISASKEQTSILVNFLSINFKKSRFLRSDEIKEIKKIKDLWWIGFWSLIIIALVSFMF